MQRQEKGSKVIRQQTIYEGKWLGMKYVDYTIGDRQIKNYQKIFRTTSKPNRLDGVDIIPIIQYQGKKSELVMIIQFRPPVKGYCLQFPTGLAESQDYKQNALRELLEETGYIAHSIIEAPAPVIYYDPWKSDQNSIIFVAKINGDNSHSKTCQKLEPSENIAVIKFEINDKLLQEVVKYCKQNNLHMESKVYTLCLGLWLKNNLCSVA